MKLPNKHGTPYSCSSWACSEQEGAPPCFQTGGSRSSRSPADSPTPAVETHQVLVWFTHTHRHTQTWSYLHGDHQLDDLAGHTLVGKPKEQLEAVSWKRTAKPWIHQVLRSAELPLNHGGAQHATHSHTCKYSGALLSLWGGTALFLVKMQKLHFDVLFKFHVCISAEPVCSCYYVESRSHSYN